jgi:hypothetical protein
MRGGGIAPPFFTSAFDGGERSPLRPCRFTLEEIAPGTHWIESWWAPEPVWTLWSTDKSLAPAGNQTPAVQSVARRYRHPSHNRPGVTLEGTQLNKFNSISLSHLHLYRSSCLPPSVFPAVIFMHFFNDKCAHG